VTPYLESLIVFGAAYALVAAAVHIPLLAGHLFLPQVGLMLVAAYTGGALARDGVPWIAAAAAGIGASVVAAGVIGMLGLRLTDFPLAIATVAVAEALRLVITSTGILGGVTGLSGIPSVATWVTALAGIAAAMALLAYFHSSYVSRAAIALGGDETAARAFGVRPGRVKLQVALLSGLLCGAGGVLYAAYVRFLNPEFFGFETLVFILVFTVVGGSRSMLGPFLGVTLLWLLPEYMVFLEDYRLIAYSVVVIAILAIQPGGLVAILADALALGRRLIAVPLATTSPDPDPVRPARGEQR
jgi:branched-chain amino acid transport system permease protein